VRQRFGELAVILGEYNHPNRPFISRWADSITSCVEEAVISLIMKKDKRVEMGKRGREKILKEFSLECMMRDWKKFYDGIFALDC